MTRLTLQRELAYTVVIVNGPNGQNAIALLGPRVTLRNRTIRRMLREVSRPARVA